MATHNHDLTDPSIFSHWVEDTIRFGDMDATGHVNNVSYARYVETGRVPFMRSDFMPHFDGDRQRFLVGHLSIHFRAQAFWPGTARIGTRVIGVGRTSCTLGHTVMVDDLCVCTAETVMVFAEHGKPSPIPDSSRQKLLEFAEG